VFRLYPIAVRRAIAFFVSSLGDRKIPLRFNGLAKAAWKVSPYHDNSWGESDACRQVNLGRITKPLISLRFLELAQRLQ
jgi:hypothetical protein